MAEVTLRPNVVRPEVESPTSVGAQTKGAVLETMREALGQRSEGASPRAESRIDDRSTTEKAIATVQDAVAHTLVRLERALVASEQAAGEVPQGLSVVLYQKLNQISTDRGLGKASQEEVDRAVEAVDSDPDSPPNNSHPSVVARYQALRAQRAIMLAIRIALQRNQTTQLNALRIIRKQMEQAMRASLKRSGGAFREEEWIAESVGSEQAAEVAQPLEPRKKGATDEEQVVNDQGQVVAERAGTRVEQRPQELRFAGVKPEESADQEQAHASVDPDSLKSVVAAIMYKKPFPGMPQEQGYSLNEVNRLVKWARNEALEFVRGNQMPKVLAPIIAEELLFSTLKEKRMEYYLTLQGREGWPSVTELARMVSEITQPPAAETAKKRLAVIEANPGADQPTLDYIDHPEKGFKLSPILKATQPLAEEQIRDVLGPIVYGAFQSMATALPSETAYMGSVVSMGSSRRAA